MTKKTILIGALCLFLFGPLSESRFIRAQAPAQGLSIIEQFSVAKDQLLCLPVTIAGKQYSFVLDTGWAQTALANDTFDLGKPQAFNQLRTPNGAIITVPQYSGPQMFLGNLRLPKRTVITIDLAMFRKVSGQEIHGILGLDYLKDFVCRIDFDSEKVLLLKNPGPEPGEAFPISVEENGPVLNGPFLQARVEGLGPVKFLVDTGYGGRGSGDLTDELMNQLLASKHAVKANECLATDAGSTKTSLLAKLDHLTVGKMSHRRLVFGRGTMNLLSLSYLSRYTVTFDFPNSVLYLQKGRSYSDPDLLDMSGLHFLRDEGKTVIAAVDRGSPADLAGIMPGDTIVAMGGRAAEQTSLFQLRRQLCAEGQRVPLTIRRGERVYETSLALKAWW